MLGCFDPTLTPNPRTRAHAGLGLTVRAEASGKIRIVDIAAWGSARWSGGMTKHDVIEFIDGRPTRGLSAHAVGTYTRKYSL